VRKAAYLRLLAYARNGKVKADVVAFDFGKAEEAWRAQAGSPHGKIIVTLNK
jgi:NADPH2:quinone reductase